MCFNMIGLFRVLEVLSKAGRINAATVEAVKSFISNNQTQGRTGTNISRIKVWEMKIA